MSVWVNATFGEVILSQRRCVLFSVDGMRPDGLMAADGMRRDGLMAEVPPFVQGRLRDGIWTLQSHTTMPSSTLPCHTSMFFGVEPERHGITTNSWAPPVRPVVGLVEALRHAGKRCA